MSEKAQAAAENLLDSGKSVSEVVVIVQANVKSAAHQLAVLDTFNKVAATRGRYQGGAPSLGDIILDEQVDKIRKYGDSTYKLSDKQVAVIIREVYQWRKVGA